MEEYTSELGLGNEWWSREERNWEKGNETKDENVNILDIWRGKR